MLKKKLASLLWSLLFKFLNEVQLPSFSNVKILVLLGITLDKMFLIRFVFGKSVSVYWAV